jgi:putative membrane protein
MKTLVLAIDRDDDLGRKAGIGGPVVGREAVMNAAIALGLADPEDSDVNSILAAVSTYDYLKKRGQDAEVAVITGTEEADVRADDKLVRQFERVLEEVGPDDVIVVTDGAEDEYVMPMITSRAKVRGLRRVFVRQSRNIESTYYLILKALSEEKVARKILAPFGLIFIAYALATFLYSILLGGGLESMGAGTFAISIIFLVIGLYAIEKAYRMRRTVASLYRRIREDILEAKISFVTTSIAALLLLVGLLTAVDAMKYGVELLHQFLIFLSALIPWVLFAVLVREAGRVFDVWLHGGELSRGFWIIMLFVVAAGIVFYGSVDYLQYVLGYKSPAAGLPILILILSGLGFMVMAAMLLRIVREEEDVETEDTEDVGGEVQGDIEEVPVLPSE